MNHLHDWRLLPLLEQRVQTGPTRFRIPDVCVVDPADGSDPIVQVPPLLCIEVLSPEDSLVRMRARFDNYLAMGVRNIWVFDPLERVCYLADEQGIVRTAGILSIPGTPVQVLVAEVFARLDFLLAGKF